jgi:hypothetical protein
MKMTPHYRALMAAARDAVEASLRSLKGDDVEAGLVAVPGIRDRIPYPIAGPNLVGVFYATLDEAKQAHARQAGGIGPFPGLMTTNPTTHVVVEVTAPNFMFAGNRADGLVLRVNPGASLTIWGHYQVFMHRKKRIGYPVALAFVLGLSDGEGAENFGPRFESLIGHTVGVWRGLHRGDKP